MCAWTFSIHIIRIDSCTVRKGSDRVTHREGVKNMTKIRILAVAALVVMALALPQAAWASPGTNSYWGR